MTEFLDDLEEDRKTVVRMVTILEKILEGKIRVGDECFQVQRGIGNLQDFIAESCEATPKLIRLHGRTRDAAVALLHGAAYLLSDGKTREAGIIISMLGDVFFSQYSWQKPSAHLSLL